MGSIMGVLPHRWLCLGPHTEIAGLAGKRCDQPVEEVGILADLFDRRRRHSGAQHLYLGGDVTPADLRKGAPATVRQARKSQVPAYRQNACRRLRIAAVRYSRTHVLVSASVAAMIAGSAGAASRTSAVR